MPPHESSLKRELEDDAICRSRLVHLAVASGADRAGVANTLFPFGRSATIAKARLTLSRNACSQISRETIPNEEIIRPSCCPGGVDGFRLHGSFWRLPCR